MKYYSAACFKISDYKLFKDEFDVAQDLLKTWGFKQTCLHRDVDDPTHLIVVHECEDLQKARDFYKSLDFKRYIEKAGILGEPQVSFLEELARTPELVSV